MTVMVPMLTQVGYAAGLFLLAPIGDIIDRLWFVSALSAGMCLSLVALALAPSLAWLYVASVLVGMGSVLAQVLVAYAGQLAAPGPSGRTLGTRQTATLLGILLARTVSGLVSERLGWRAIHWMAAATSVVMLLGLVQILPRARAAARLLYVQALRPLRDLWCEHRQLRRSSLIGGLLFAGFSVFWSTLGYHLATPPFHYGPRIAGLYGLLGLAGAATASIAGCLTDGSGAAFAIGTGGIIAGIAFPLFALGSHSMLLLGVGVVVLDIGIQGAIIDNQSAVLSFAPKGTGRTDTIYMVIYSLGGVLGSYTGGLAWHWLGWFGVCALGFAYAAAASTIRFADAVRARAGR